MLASFPLEMNRHCCRQFVCAAAKLPAPDNCESREERMDACEHIGGAKEGRRGILLHCVATVKLATRAHLAASKLITGALAHSWQFQAPSTFCDT